MRSLEWTRHASTKLRQHGLSESRVKRVINSPERIETGIAPETVAVMKRAGTAKNPYEIWVMIRDTKASRRVISAWRYPGETKPGESLPASILFEFRIGSIDAC